MFHFLCWLFSLILINTGSEVKYLRDNFKLKISDVEVVKNGPNDVVREWTG